MYKMLQTVFKRLSTWSWSCTCSQFNSFTTLVSFNFRKTFKKSKTPRLCWTLLPNILRTCKHSQYQTFLLNISQP